jgi:predicted DNA-binding transcriptional regulator AlpA
MPFDTPAGPAVLAANIVNGATAAERLGVHRVTFYEWTRIQPDFPPQCSPGRWDYTDVYEWFVEWIKRPGTAYHYERPEE